MGEGCAQITVLTFYDLQGLLGEPDGASLRGSCLMGRIAEKIANSSSEEAEVEVRRLLRTADVCLVSDWELHPPPEPPGIMLLFSTGAATRLPDLLDKTAGNNQQENQ